MMNRLQLIFTVALLVFPRPSPSYASVSATLQKDQTRWACINSTAIFNANTAAIDCLQPGVVTPNQVAQIPPNSCIAALQSARSRLEEGRNVTTEVRDLDITRSYSDYPFGRSSGYVFVMQGSATQSILNSPQLLTSVSENVINSCESVGLVEFVENYTDYIRVFGLLGDTVEEFSCQDFDASDLRAGRRRPPLGWGEQVCL